MANKDDWRNNLGKGKACKVWDVDSDNTINAIVVEYTPRLDYPYRTLNGTTWKHARLMTNKELIEFNTPSDIKQIEVDIPKDKKVEEILQDSDKIVVKLKPKEWYHNLSAGKVLCWVWDYDGKTRQLGMVTGYQKGYTFPFLTTMGDPGNCLVFRHATPVKLAEIIDNILDIEISINHD